MGEWRLHRIRVISIVSTTMALSADAVLPSGCSDSASGPSLIGPFDSKSVEMEQSKSGSSGIRPFRPPMAIRATAAIPAEFLIGS